MFFFPVSGVNKEYYNKLVGEWRPIMIIRGNLVSNDKVVEALGSGYMSLVVSKGKDFEVINNTIEGILNTKEGVETIPFYCSASNHLLVKNNRVMNCGSTGMGLNYGGNCLIKLKDSFRCDIVNNEFIFNREGLKDLGLIDSEDIALENANFDSFRFSLWGANLLNRVTDHGYYHFTNNIFSASVISDYSFASRHNFILSYNDIFIEYLYPSKGKNWSGNTQVLSNTLIYFRESVENGKIQIEGNRIQIEYTSNGTIYFTRDINDNKSFSEVSYLNNIFEANTIISLAYPRTKKLISQNELIGEGSFTYNYAITSKPNRSIKSLNVEHEIARYKAGKLPTLDFNNFGSSSFSTKFNNDTITNILMMNYDNLSFYDRQDRMPLHLIINGRLTYHSGKKENFHYGIIVKDKDVVSFIDDKSGMIKNIRPYWLKGKPQFRYNIQPISIEFNNDIKLSIVSSSRWKSQEKVGYLIMSKLKQVREFKITVSIENLIVPANESLDTFISNILKKRSIN